MVGKLTATAGEVCVDVETARGGSQGDVFRRLENLRALERFSPSKRSQVTPNQKTIK